MPKPAPAATSSTLSAQRCAAVAVASAFFYALSALMTNWLGRTESTTVQSVTFVIMNLIIGALFWAILGEGWAVDHAPEGLDVLLKAWVWPSRADVLIMVGIGLGSAIGFIMLTAAYRNLEPSFAAPFEYCLLGYNLLWVLLLFRQVPDVLTLIGIAIIVSSGLFVLYREGERRQSLSILSFICALRIALAIDVSGKFASMYISGDT